MFKKLFSFGKKKDSVKNIAITGLMIAIVIIVTKKCEQEPKVIIKTETKIVQKTDTITETIIEDNYITRYVDRIKTIKGKDSIIYVSDSTAIEAREYEATVKTDSAKAELKILTTGELLDVKGVITYPEKETITEITKIKPKSGLFLYGETSIQPTLKRFEIGLDYQFRNTVIIGTSGSYDNISKKFYVNAKLGIRIF